MDVDDIKYAVDRRATIEPEGITRDTLRSAGCLDRIAVLPAEYNERMSYLADVLVQSISTKSVKDDRLRFTVGQLCQALSYMMNSCSWRDGELHDFDYEELQSKLGPFVKTR